MKGTLYNSFLSSLAINKKHLAILIDPDKFNLDETSAFLERIPSQTTHLFVGGSTVAIGETEKTVKAIREVTKLPIILFPGDYTQITTHADAILFLSLVSGRNPEYLIGQQVKSIPCLIKSSLEILPTGYILIDGGNRSAVSRVTETTALSQNNMEEIVHTAIAGMYMGAKLIYLEAGSGADYPVHPEIIRQVKKAIDIPLLVGGGIRTTAQKEDAYSAGADMIVIGTLFEE